jgi:hypothetical protein
MTSRKSNLLFRKSAPSIAGTDMILVKIWHMTIFIFLISFLTLFVFFYTFQPGALLGSRDWLYDAGEGGVRKTNSSSENKMDVKWLSDKGRVTIFAWSIGLGAAISILFHFIMVYS